jgi:hypothetical protein
MVADSCAWARRHLSLPAFHSLRIRVTPEPAIRNVLSVCDPRAHPWRYASAIALLAGIAVPLLDLVVLAVQARLNGPQLSDLAITAPALIAIEATLVIACYAILGPYLGLRPTRKRP